MSLCYVTAISDLVAPPWPGPFWGDKSTFSVRTNLAKTKGKLCEQVPEEKRKVSKTETLTLKMGNSPAHILLSDLWKNSNPSLQEKPWGRLNSTQGKSLVLKTDTFLKSGMEQKKELSGKKEDVMTVEVLQGQLWESLEPRPLGKGRTVPSPFPSKNPGSN